MTSTCVDPETGALDDHRLYAAGRERAYAGRYADTLRVFAAMQETDSPRALTAHGYAQRKSGRTDEGLALYAQASARDPAFQPARACLRLHRLEQGPRAQAKAPLVEIEVRSRAGPWLRATPRHARAGFASLS